MLSLGFVEVFAGIWCFALGISLAHMVMIVVAIVQIVSRNMPTDQKLLWCLVCWFVPLVGPILWWAIGAKQNPEGPRFPPGPGGP